MNKRHSIIFNSFCLMLIVFFSQSDTQALSIQGKVAASRYCVQYAAVTFIANADTTIKYSALTNASGCYQVDVLTSVEFNTNDFPDKFQLAQNYPNPVFDLTAIPYNLNKCSDVQLTIYDILGREVREFAVGIQSAGSHDILWDGSDSFGNRVANGIYFCRLQAEDESRTVKMIMTSGSTGTTSLSRAFPSSAAKVLSHSILEGNYTVRIENTDNTSPFVVPKQFENIPIKNDTTIDFTVDFRATVTVNLDSTHQYIRGFGASNILCWRSDMTDSEIKTAFGTGEGQLGFTILRVMVEPNSSRWSLYVPTAKKAHDMGATIIASPWYAPTNMVETVNAKSRVRYNMYGAYAAHLNSFNTYMKNNGVFIYGLSVQNEPDVGDWTRWTANEMYTFVRDYAHAIEGTNVMAPESFHFDRTYCDPILNDSVACANTDIVCGHIYGGGLALYPLAEQKGKENWMTEYLINSGNPPTNPSIDTGWTGAIQAAKSISDCMNANMSAYVWWYIIRYYGPISDGTNNSGNKGEVTKKGYVMSQYSRFIRPGYYRVECNILPWSCNVYVTAFKDSSSSKAVIVAVNNNSAPMDLAIRIQNGSMNLFTPYTTTECKNCVQGDDIHIIDNWFAFQLEASSIITFVSK